MTPPTLAIRPSFLWRGLASVFLGAALLAACGGGTSQVSRFEPQRLLAFGDELSFLTDDGHKYGVNALNSTDKTLDCVSSPLWVQVLASHYGMVFGQCLGTSNNSVAFREATESARVDDVATRINNYLSGAGFQNSDLVTVLVGMHDVLDAYGQYDGSNEADLIATLSGKGQQLSGLVHQIVSTGARVIVSTVPDMGLTPFALAERANVGDDRPQVLTNLTDAFNKSFRLGLSDLDGSSVGLLIADDLTKAMVKVPAAHGLTDVTRAVCVTALPGCTTDTLMADAGTNPSPFLWADNLRPANTFQLQLGNQAVARVNTLPF